MFSFAHSIFFREYSDDLRYDFYEGYRNNIRRFNSSKIPSKSFQGVMLIIFVGISSLIKKRMPLPWEFLLYLHGGAYPSFLNCAWGKEESSFVSKNIRMSMLSFAMLDNISNLFLELIFNMSYNNPFYIIYSNLFQHFK